MIYIYIFIELNLNQDNKRFRILDLILMYLNHSTFYVFQTYHPHACPQLTLHNLIAPQHHHHQPIISWISYLNGRIINRIGRHVDDTSCPIIFSRYIPQSSVHRVPSSPFASRQKRKINLLTPSARVHRARGRERTNAFTQTSGESA